MKAESNLHEGKEEARLLPVLADRSKEGRCLSVFLACLSRVHEFGRILLETLGEKIGKRTRIETFTEVKSPLKTGDKAYRPDGLIVVSTGTRSWSALVEAKIGSTKLDKHQISSYMKLAREQNKPNKIEINAVITISNEFTAMPSHHPIKTLRSSKNVHLFHWSWASILTYAKLLEMSQDVKDPNQKFLLREFVRFLDDRNTGVMRFDRMTGDWKNLVASVAVSAVTQKSLDKKSDMVVDTVASWHQKTRDLALLLSAKFSVPNVSVKLTRKHKNDPNARIQDDAKHLTETNQLSVEYHVGDTTSRIAPIVVIADLRGKSITVSMKLPAPKDKRTTRGRLRWLLRQLEKGEEKDLYIRAYWPNRSRPLDALLGDLQSNPNTFSTNPSISPASFEVFMVRDAGNRFSGPKTFVEELEETVLRFYEQVGQRLKRWQPAAPRIRGDSKETAISGAGESSTELANPDSEDSPATQRPPPS